MTKPAPALLRGRAVAGRDARGAGIGDSTPVERHRPHAEGGGRGGAVLLPDRPLRGHQLV